MDDEFQSTILPLAARVPGRFRQVLAQQGADYFAWRSAWFRELEHALAAEVAADGR
jgi:hypothetical protein